MTNEEILEKFNYNLLPAVADLALNLARADEREGKWISVEDEPPVKETKDYWVAILMNDGTFMVMEAKYMIVGKVWVFCNYLGWELIIKPSHYQIKVPPTPPHQTNNTKPNNQ